MLKKDLEFIVSDLGPYIINRLSLMLFHGASVQICLLTSKVSPQNVLCIIERAREL